MSAVTITANLAIKKSGPKKEGVPMVQTCDQPGCTFTCDKTSLLKSHRVQSHGLDPAVFKCTIPGCDYKAKIGGHVKRHLSNIHDVDVAWHSCDQDGCTFRSKEASNLRCHKKRVHQITWTAMRTHGLREGGNEPGSSSPRVPKVKAPPKQPATNKVPAPPAPAQIVVPIAKSGAVAAPKPLPPKVNL